jgi:hypothetical protein
MMDSVVFSIIAVFGFAFFLFFCIIVYAAIFIPIIDRKREKFIQSAPFPKGLLSKLSKKHPNLAWKDAQLVSTALRHFFLAYHHAQYQYLAMPSEVVDDLWHEFILYTREYEQFCKQAFGRFFHHTPAAVLGDHQNSDIGLRRTWFNVCKIEFIDPKNPTRLPLLFAIDGKLSIADGRLYSLNCEEDKPSGGGGTCCVGSFSGGDGASCGGGSDGGDSGGGDGGGCGGGCGGGGD